MWSVWVGNQWTDHNTLEGAEAHRDAIESLGYDAYIEDDRPRVGPPAPKGPFEKQMDKLMADYAAAMTDRLFTGDPLRKSYKE